MSFLNLIVSSFLSIIVWYEVGSTPTLSSRERGSFIGVGVVETALAVVSILGFVGAIVRKQSFVTIYCICLYVHFLINLGVAGYFLYVILHAEHSDAIEACKDAIQDTNAQDQCLGLLNIAKGVYAAVASVLLLLELYGALMATRYVHQVKTEKRKARLPLHLRGDSDSTRLNTSYVRYSDPSGEQLYDSYPSKQQGGRPTSTYSYASATTLFDAPGHTEGHDKGVSEAEEWKAHGHVGRMSDEEHEVFRGEYEDETHSMTRVAEAGALTSTLHHSNPSRESSEEEGAAEPLLSSSPGHGPLHAYHDGHDSGLR